MKRFPRPAAALLLAACALLAFACGSVAGGSASGAGPTTEPSATASQADATPPPGGLTNADDRTTVTIRVGDIVNVALHADPGFGNWSHPDTSDPAVLAPRVNPAAAAVMGATLARYQGVSPGSVQLTSAESHSCSPGMGCPAVAKTWTVTVVVRP